MKRYSILWFTVLLCWLSGGCKDFLNEYSQSLSYIETAADLQESGSRCDCKTGWRVCRSGVEQHADERFHDVYSFDG